MSNSVPEIFVADSVKTLCVALFYNYIQLVDFMEVAKSQVGAESDAFTILNSSFVKNPIVYSFIQFETL